MLSYFFSSIAFYAGWRSQASSFNMASSMALHFHRQSTTIEREFAPKLQHREHWATKFSRFTPSASCRQGSLQNASSGVNLSANWSSGGSIQLYILFENSQQLKKNAGIKVELNPLVKLYFHVDRALIRCYSLFNFLFQLKQNMFTCCNNRRCEK